jgi:hypothetical protein
MRRRLVRTGTALLAAGAISVIVLLVPEPKPPNPNPVKNAPPAKLISPVNEHVSPAARRGINATLDRFIPAALGHQSMATAWQLSGPELKGGSSLRQWQSGTSPFPYYPPGGETFHGWTTIDAGPKYVVFNLLVHERSGDKTASRVFSGEMVKRGSRWVVNRLYTIATMQKPTKGGQHEVGPADYAASSPTGEVPRATPGLGKEWLLVGGGVVLLVFLFPAAFLVGSAVRSRRRRRRYEQSHGRSLPPLPGSGSGPADGARN